MPPRTITWCLQRLDGHSIRKDDAAAVQAAVDAWAAAADYWESEPALISFVGMPGDLNLTTDLTITQWSDGFTLALGEKSADLAHPKPWTNSYAGALLTGRPHLSSALRYVLGHLLTGHFLPQDLFRLRFGKQLDATQTEIFREIFSCSPC